MIIDCFPFFNELDLLKVRLHELNDCVDWFVLVEASKTQTFQDKPFYFEQNKQMFSKFLSKIIHIKINKFPKFNHLWGMENFQRNSINLGLSKIKNLKAEQGYILISDLDEIPSKRAIEKILDSNISQGSLDLDSFAYFFNFKSNQKWTGPAFCKIEEFFKTPSPQHWRNIKDNLPRIKTNETLGWHFSWMGGIKKIYQKMLSNIEPYDKSKIPDINTIKEKIERCINANTSFVFEGQSGKFNFVDFKNQVFPDYVMNSYKEYSKHFFIKYDYVVENNCPGLGDSLTFTPMYRTHKKIKIVLPDTPQAKKISVIYDNMFDVEFRQTVKNTFPGDIPNTHVSKGRLMQMGFPECKYTPLVLLTEEEILNGKMLLKNFSNPVAIINSPSNVDPVSLQPSSRSINRKVQKPNFWETIVSILVNQGYTPIQFGISTNIEKISNICNTMLDLSIRELASVYYNIGRYVGVDTGDHHLMLAVGGKAVVFYPDFIENGIPYPSYQWQYSSDSKIWEDGIVRAKYISKHIDVDKLSIQDLIF